MSRVQLIGRDNEVQRLFDCVRPGRVTTLLGAPGVGKTSLANDFAAQKSGDVHALVLLADATDGDALVEAVAERLGCVGRSNHAQLAENIGRTLSRLKTGIVILDNCEHLLDDVKAMILIWRKMAPEMAWLATSQVRLHLSDEQLVDVGPLQLSTDSSIDSIRDAAAVQLLVNRMRDVRSVPDPIPDEMLTTLGQIADALDGLPLALELAARRMRILTPQEVLVHLQERFRLLRSRHQSSQNGRHATLETALEWSWSQLPPWARHGLAQCSVFAGGFEHSAAEAVIDVSNLDDSPEFIDVLETLLDHSLLQRREVDGVTWFSMLVSVREFALAQCSDVSALRARHAQYYGILGRKMAAKAWRRSGPERQWLIRNRLNLQQVTDTMSDHGQHVSAASAVLGLDEILYTTPIRSHLTRLEGSGSLGTLEPKLAAELGIARARSLRFLGQAEESANILSPIVKDAKARHLDTVYVSALADLARAQRIIGRIEESQSNMRIACDFAKDRGIETHYHTIIGSQALAYLSTGSLMNALRELRVFHEYAVAHEFDQMERVSAVNLGRCHVELGELEEAHRYFARSVELGALINHEWSMGYGHCKLGEVAMLRGQSDEAAREFEKSLTMLRRSGDGLHEAETTRAIADNHALCGELESAASNYEDAVALAQRHGAPKIAIGALTGMALIHCLNDAWITAVEYASKGITAAKILNDPTLLATTQAICTAVTGLAGCAVHPMSDESARTDFPRVKVGHQLAQLALAVTKISGPQLAKNMQVLREGEGGLPGATTWFETQMLLRIVQRRISPQDLVAVADENADLVISKTGFKLPNQDWVDLSKKDLLMRFVNLLVDAHTQGPGEPIELDRLIDLLWPGEHMIRDAGATRVYTAVSNLRRAGLKGILLRKSGGYLIDDGLRIVRLHR